LVGYNTDYYGARKVFTEHKIGTGNTMLLFGVGGVARALVLAALDEGLEVLVSARDPKKLSAFSQEFGVESLPWEERNTYKADVLMNATSVGMEPETDVLPLAREALTNFSYIGDIVIKPPRTLLLQEAEKAGIHVMGGHEFVFEQAAKQYELYTGEPAPRDIMKKALQVLLD
ncbi:hypothetical protein GOV10_06750, partial [Candidatus Woesearchaeota archaeon]|nr:hypothetical protein [Candidatus Woesearchaeota archaeon]